MVTDGGVVVFDALGTPAPGCRLLQRIREVTDLPVERIVISHYPANRIYGLQAFREHAGNPPVWAQALAPGYVGGTAASQGEDAQRRLAQRRQALFPWVDGNTRIVPPDHPFAEDASFEVGGVTFVPKHLGPAHAPGDSILLDRDDNVRFSGDVIYEGRVRILDSPQTDIDLWLEGLDYRITLQPPPDFVIPGHGTPSADVSEAVAATRDDIVYVRDAMRQAVRDFIPFDQACEAADWFACAAMPAFAASNRGNACRIYLDLEAGSLE
jgi:glyoxylase-like metal-dependent hydrolase (beta-lactamase superfamily II)